MRYVAFLLLLLLSLYFLVVKPYLTAKRVYYRVEGLGLSLSPFNLRVRLIYLYLPFQGKYIFLNLTGLSLELHEEPKLSLREGNLTIVEEARSRGKKGGERKPPYLVIPEFLKTMELEIGKFLFTYAGEGNISVLAEGVKLKDRTLRGEVKVLAEGRQVNVRIGRVRLLKEGIGVESLKLSSDLFDLSLRGIVKEGEPTASFELVGTVKEIDLPTVYVAPVKLRGKGRANYRGVSILLKAETEKVWVKGRKSFSGVRASGLATLLFGKELTLRGRLESPSIDADYSLELMPRKHLSLTVRRFPVDSELIGTENFFFAWAGGSLELDLDRGDLSLLAETDGIGVEGLAFGGAEFSMDYNYRTGKGSLELAVRNPAELYLSGHINNSSFRSRLLLKNLLLVSGGLSTFLSYRGRFDYEGTPMLKGRGVLGDVFYRDFLLGKVNYTVELKGERIDLTYRGKGFSGEAKGTIGGGILSITELKSFKRKFRGYNLYVNKGSVELSLSGEKLALALDLKESRLSGAGVSVPFNWKLKLLKEKELTGNFLLLAKNVSVGERLFPEDIRVNGEIASSRVKGRYEISELLEGEYSIDLHKKLLKTHGSVRKGPLRAEFVFRGSPAEGSVRSQVSLDIKGERTDVGLTAQYSDGNFEIRVSPFAYRYRVSELKFGGARVTGEGYRGNIELGKVSFSILGKPAVVLREKEGSFNLMERALKLSLVSRGAISGTTVVSYSKEEGLSVNSSGDVDLDALSFFVATPIGGNAKGKLGYRFSYSRGNMSLLLKNRGRVVTYSRYFAFPMDAWVELRALGKSLSAFITVWRDNSGLSANVGSNDLKSYYVYLTSRDLPFAYRTHSFSLKLDVSSEGWVRVSDLSKVSVNMDMLLSGEAEITKLGGGKGKKERGAEEVELDVRFDTSKPIRVSLPEGYVYVKVKGWVGGKASDPRYAVNVEFLSGELTYFGRRFFVRGGTVTLLREEEVKESSIDISLVNPSEDMSIFINLRGDLEEPSIVVWSEPPRSTQEILTKLVIGSTAEGLIPVAKTLFKQLGYLGNVRSGLSSLLGVDITLSTQTGTQGDIGINVNIKKKIARAFTIEYQQSTLKDPRSTYYGGSISLPGGTYFYGRVFADNTSEIKLRFIRKFDF